MKDTIGFAERTKYLSSCNIIEENNLDMLGLNEPKIVTLDRMDLDYGEFCMASHLACVGLEKLGGYVVTDFRQYGSESLFVVRKSIGKFFKDGFLGRSCAGELQRVYSKDGEVGLIHMNFKYFMDGKVHSEGLAAELSLAEKKLAKMYPGMIQRSPFSVGKEETVSSEFAEFIGNLYRS